MAEKKVIRTRQDHLVALGDEGLEKLTYVWETLTKSSHMPMNYDKLREASRKIRKLAIDLEFY